MRVDGELLDLARRVPAGTRVEPVTISSPDGLNILRHSAAHVLAQAVQQINPDARLGIGPPVTDGFYYDFDVPTAFSSDDFSALTKAMERIIRAEFLEMPGMRLTRRQFRRLWNLNDIDCDRLVRRLIGAGFLVENRDVIGRPPEC